MERILSDKFRLFLTVCADTCASEMMISIKILPDGELNPGLPRDRRGYLPLYYRGFDEITMNLIMLIHGLSES